LGLQLNLAFHQVDQLPTDRKPQAGPADKVGQVLQGLAKDAPQVIEGGLKGGVKGGTSGRVPGSLLGSFYGAALSSVLSPLVGVPAGAVFSAVYGPMFGSLLAPAGVVVGASANLWQSLVQRTAEAYR